MSSSLSFTLPSKPPLISPPHLPSYSPSIESLSSSLKSHKPLPLSSSKKPPSSRPTVLTLLKEVLINFWLFVFVLFFLFNYNRSLKCVNISIVTTYSMEINWNNT